MLPLVALVGRPNVGKSTIFNALTRTRDALVHDQPGVTRDRNYGVCRLDEDNPFLIVDTGGIAEQEEGLAGATARQARAAAEEADLIVFVVDARDGTSSLDDDILAWLRKQQQPKVLLINKIDGTDEHTVRAEFSRYGFSEMMTVSAAHRQGLDDLLEEIVERLPEEGSAEEMDNDPNRVRIAFVGRPNVGKSTLVNRILGEERMIASEVPGTTRDSISVDLEREGRDYRLIDTAGLRRRGRVDEAVEKFSVVKTMQAIEQCQVAVLMLDAHEGVTDQDATVLGAVLDAGRALVIAINKWDGLTDYQREQAETQLSLRLGFVPWAESVRISAMHGSGLRELFNAVHRAHASANHQFSTSEVNQALEVAYQANPPPTIRGHVSKLRYVHPGGANPPTFIVHGTRLKELSESYKRYLENFFRKRFKLVGTPVQFIFREGANPYEGKKNPLTERQVKAKRRLMKHVKGR
ncbi:MULTISPECIES: ribosome biogenesis GTPase Der [unclassified Stenotrophomonas]|uniref:ribosome biogenesis GTPase Der n=1 Tax=unclassified Stenotrophomonas TaxID=196198 RepID=UPI00177D11F1|nr:MULTISPECIES: ribosome biogenesis GTPase Der [unclassified Stenotrophomonas]MBD8635362.1 ribosome biogenesis GTPase Der [Stenotrophomonas sp. CFBP 13725]MBD8694887.1 ribosome biogenesis GTPase Der [Stenotrophomonas sp. CFBP 13718]